MARVAVVTGGTRGIGAAISKALKASGYKVAATYAGNDEAAQKFKAETGIPVYKWDVSDPDACAAQLKRRSARGQDIIGRQSQALEPRVDALVVPDPNMNLAALQQGHLI